MPTSVRQLQPQDVTADTTPAAIDITTTVEVTTPTYYVRVVSGGGLVYLLPPTGAARTSTLSTQAGDAPIEAGPLRVADGAPRLYATSGTACVVDVLEVTGEGRG